MGMEKRDHVLWDIDKEEIVGFGSARDMNHRAETINDIHQSMRYVVVPVRPTHARVQSLDDFVEYYLEAQKITYVPLTI